jgi:hypothetical protein
MPNLDVIRPCDGEETAGAFAASVERLDGPTALILTRQNVPDMRVASATTRRYGTLKGGYIIKKEAAALELIIIATGSEVQHAVAAAEVLGMGVRVVSMPCMERFDRQSEGYKAEVLPAGVKKIAMEAGVSGLWYKYADKLVGVDRFGFSAPGGTVMDFFGINAGHLTDVAQSMLTSDGGRGAATHHSSNFKSTQSETWSRFECKTLDSLPEYSDSKFQNRTLDSLPEYANDDSSDDGTSDDASSVSVKNFNTKGKCDGGYPQLPENKASVTRTATLPSLASAA